MQQFRLLLLILGFPLLLAACGEVTGNPDSRFVPVESLIDEQIKLLSSLNPKVAKRVQTGEGEETKVLRNINWQKELAAFRIADISKPGLQGAYTVESPAPNVRLFRLKDDQNSEVQELRIEFGENNRVKALEAVINDKNYLYHTQRTLRLVMDKEAGGRFTVSAYEIAGSQKLIWSLQKPFSLRAKVL